MGRLKAALKLFLEFARFGRDNRAYWIVPLILLLGAIGLIVVVGETAAPLIYALF